MTKEELKRKYGIHKIENESPSTEGASWRRALNAVRIFPSGRMEKSK